ncbi:endolytic transglycosylase MltG [Bombella sp. TMW 2.2559]|uniref:Endolytic murein transglycosylase n=1 Tax=Bombella dulcis TaxID=2967339 RepID=A0ABT3W9M7_9PROT|nr:endolytic transglycosylase MltG [Bombella dulcis]MCX5615790.1 endolytic transglycosylase MltG [Bombella dulcis]
MTQKPASEISQNGGLSQGKEEGRARKRFRLITKGRVFALLTVTVGGMFFAGYGHYTDPGPLQAERVIVIPRGGMDRVIAVLQDNGVLARGSVSSLFFKAAIFATRSQGSIHAAELKFPERVSMAHSLDILRHGHSVTHSLTIAEGLTAHRIKTLLMQAPALQGEVPAILEGTVAPQTFFYVWGMERQTLLQHMTELMSNILQDVWSRRDKAALEGVVTTPEQLLILASLIERETSLPKERPQVARVFLNRLKLGMKLQTDPTVIYALSGGEGTLPRPLTHGDLQFDNPYNSYLHSGLPPGPICSPGRDSLEAAAHPAAGDALYFVATGHGGHNFARTLAEQTNHVRAYRRVKKSTAP